ncbi:MAG: hypothetical protein JO262_12830 [Solirubrobacterales bacterium]|nr:hypothetical protein [Solirubrobacterales bacterium]
MRSEAVGTVGSGAVRSEAVGTVGSGAVRSEAAGERDIERGPVICEYHAEGVNAPAVMIREGRWKLIVCRDDPDQLFDLSQDPLELVNLAQSPRGGAVVGELRAELERRLDLADIERRVLESQRERRVVAAALAVGEVFAWDYQPYVDASMQYVRTREDLYELQRRGRLEAR